MTTPAAIYVYGVVGEGSAPGVKTVGVGSGDTPVRTLTQGQLAAVVSDVDPGFSRASRDDLARHTAILQEIAAAKTVIPLRFGTVLPDEEGVEALLERHQGALRQLLDRLSGRVELSLKATYEETAFGDIVAEWPAVADLRERLRGRPEAATYYDRIRLGELVAEAMSVMRQRDTDAILTPLRDLAEDVRLSDVTHERGVLNAAFLLPRERMSDFDRAADQVAERHANRIQFRYAGPLPPYDFVTGDPDTPWG